MRVGETGKIIMKCIMQRQELEKYSTEKRKGMPCLPMSATAFLHLGKSLLIRDRQFLSVWTVWLTLLSSHTLHHHLSIISVESNMHLIGFGVTTTCKVGCSYWVATHSMQYQTAIFKFVKCKKDDFLVKEYQIRVLKIKLANRPKTRIKSYQSLLSPGQQ
jgi:hypothetical protein